MRAYCPQLVLLVAMVLLASPQQSWNAFFLNDATSGSAGSACWISRTWLLTATPVFSYLQLLARSFVQVNLRGDPQDAERQFRAFAKTYFSQVREARYFNLLSPCKCGSLLGGC